MEDLMEDYQHIDLMAMDLGLTISAFSLVFLAERR